MEDKLSFKCVEKHLMHLRFGGYYQIDPRSPRLYRTLHNIYMKIMLIWIIVFTIQQALKVYEVRHDLDKVMGTLFLFLTHTDSIYKQIVVWIKSEKIEELLDIMRGPLFNQEEPEHKMYLLQVANTSTLVLRIDNGLALCTCFLWMLLPFVLHLQGKPVEFGIWLPFDVNKNPTFYIVLLYVWVTTSWLAFCNTTVDVLVSFMFGQCKTQLTILRHDLHYLTKKGQEEHIITGEPYADIIRRRFRKMLQHHVQIVYFVEQVEDIFSTAIAYQFLISGWIICTSVYRMVNMSPASVQYLSMVLYICCMLIEIFIYCYYGNEVTVESGNLTESAYASNWLETNLIHRRHLILFMERVKRPLQPLAGRLIPLSNNTFVTIVKNSYTFYALLKTTSE